MTRKVNKGLKAVLSGLLLLCTMSFFGLTALAAENSTAIMSNYPMKAGEESAAEILIENNDTKAHSFTLQAVNIPNGMTGYFTVDYKSSTELSLQAASSAVIEFHLVVSADTSAKSAQIEIDALRDDGVKTSTSISFLKNSDYTLQMANTTDNLEAVSGETLNFDVAVRNTGDKELTDLSLTVDYPYKWIQDSVSPEKLTLKPGESSTFHLSVSIPVSQSSGSSTIKLTAVNANMTSSELAIPVRVAANANYVWILLGIALIAAIAVLLYFRRHRRR